MIKTIKTNRGLTVFAYAAAAGLAALVAGLFVSCCKEKPKQEPDKIERAIAEVVEEKPKKKEEPRLKYNPKTGFTFDSHTSKYIAGNYTFDRTGYESIDYMTRRNLRRKGQKIQDLTEKQRNDFFNDLCSKIDANDDFDVDSEAHDYVTPIREMDEKNAFQTSKRQLEGELEELVILDLTHRSAIKHNIEELKGKSIYTRNHSRPGAIVPVIYREKKKRIFVPIHNCVEMYQLVTQRDLPSTQPLPWFWIQDPVKLSEEEAEKLLKE